MNRVFAIGISLLSTTSMGLAAEFRVAEPMMTYYGEHRVIELDGNIQQGDGAKLRATIAEIRETEIGGWKPILLKLSSLGGALDPGIELADTVREQGLTTFVDGGDYCLSACALVFMSGTFYSENVSSQRRIMHPKAILGFHAPFAFGNNEGLTAILPEVAIELLPNVERGAAIAASKILQLSVSGSLPTSLAQELLTYEADRFLYIDSVDRAGRWSIDLHGAERLRAPDSLVTEEVREALDAHCTNMKNWNLEIALADRVTEDHPDYPFDSFTLTEMCGHDADGEFFTYRHRGSKGEFYGAVLFWQTLEPSIKLANISEEELLGPSSIRAPFDRRNEPPSQVDGECVGGYQWIGGWSGMVWSDSIAHATVRNCEGITQQILSFSCIHGSSNFELKLGSGVFSPANPEAIVAVIVDGDTVGHVYGDKEARSDFVGFGDIHVGRKSPFLQQLKSGSMLTFRSEDEEFSVHLSGSKKALSALEASCL